ncbi:hypothetical protein Kpol_1042p1 [Vanderwaltozyma polyspora DSM 70294]|uniref:sphingosine kinase n=1 Tax=Vanderwaltozyma polyspora (strain ATCC 22028 / DSM 70294 / BCRC 21397 / CBS 2163 / NBRC 10782 / NRRL Y-8283 / UCD 57-17) TaxID=436907 RepID=A7TQ90_VANPO|nr:uncharacterized protein Kpol_1042p1 [Vanderwaltozyma polyspora DSM 70294]EDO15544.1 hypothetical protein Kpol_1042p1 [Vanderwaltozyma polyspora DSM 70294]
MDFSSKTLKKKSSKLRKERIYSKAILIDTGILITAQPDSDSLKSTDSRRSHSHTHSRTSLSDNHEDLINSSNLDDDDDNDDIFETASLISCVTCLSDTFSKTSNTTTTTTTTDLPYTSLKGKFPTNTVIPYGRILHAKFIDRNRDSNMVGKIRTKSSSRKLRGSIASIDLNLSGVESNGSSNESFARRSSIELKDYAVNRRLSNVSIGHSIFDDDYESSTNLIEITFAKPRRHDVVAKKLLLDIDDSLLVGNGIVQEILERSYRGTKRKRKILVIINPYGGKGNAKKLFMTKCYPLLIASRCTVDLAYTKFSGHAITLAEALDINKYDTIACASGDGIPYEVINGLYRRKDRVEAFNKLTITQLPCGSGNAMSVSCHWTDNPSYATLSLVKSTETRIDIMCCSQPSYYNEHPRLSFLSQTYGVIAESDINTEFIRWLGAARFEIGVAFNILQRKKYPCDIYVKYAAKTKNDVKTHYMNYKNNGLPPFDIETDNIYCADDIPEVEMISEENFKLRYPFSEGIPDDWEKLDSSVTDNIGIFYTGKMPYIAADTKFFPAALPSDGVMEMVITDGRTAVSRMVPILLALDKGTHIQQPEVLHSKILAYKIVPKIKNTVFAVDGEKFPLEPLQVEVLPRLCKTLLRNGRFVETEFDTI